MEISLIRSLNYLSTSFRGFFFILLSRDTLKEIIKAFGPAKNYVFIRKTVKVIKRKISKETQDN